MTRAAFLTVCRALALLCLATPAVAQQGWFVDPTTGSDGNDGLTQATPFRSLTHALTVASSGDNVFLAAGTYSSFETFPIGLRDGVGFGPLGAGEVVFDAGGAAVGFTVAEDVSMATTVRGVTVRNAVTGLEVPSGRSVVGLTVEGWTFEPTDVGARVRLTTTAGDQDLTFSDCTFAGGGSTACLIEVSSGATLATGGVLDCTVSGAFGDGIVVTATDSALVASGFTIERNDVSAFTGRGIHLLATGSGGNVADVATVSAGVIANRISGGGAAGTTGIRLEAVVGALGEGARISGRVDFDLVEGCEFGVVARTVGDGAATVEVIDDFFGNVFEGCTTAVVVDSTLPVPGARNCDPNLGGDGEGGIACLNTFTGATTDFDLDPDQVATLSAKFDWFDGPIVTVDGAVETDPVYSDPLEGTIGGGLVANQDGQTLSLTAGPTTGFVDYDGPGDVGQITVTVDGVAVPQSDITMLPIGAGLEVVLPALAAGSHQLVATNPGGQSGTFQFEVNASAGGGAVEGGSGAGCFVATAAHGDYDAPDVVVLRGLRDEYLALTPPGRAFIRWYYAEGPKAAAWIAEHPWARAATRAALRPLVWTTEGLNGANPGQRLALAVAFLGAAFALRRVLGG